jgi:ATP-binding cassette subfamily F protein 3
MSWTIQPRSRIGLVGDNGTGKTTLFRVILGEINPDSGSIEIPNIKKKNIGYLPQDLVELDSIRVIDYLKNISGIAMLEQNIQEMENEISQCKEHNDIYAQLTKKYSELSALYSSQDGYSFEARARQTLKGFGFKDSDALRNCAEFSGGWKMRILLSSILLSRPNIMLLDEPTNHLDTESMEWLESYLKDYDGTLVTISHDRFFLDKIVTQIAELSSGQINIYSGNYSYYLKEKERRLSALKKEMELQKAQIKKIEKFVERFRYKATKAAQVQSRVKMLEKYDDITDEKKTKKVFMKFPEGSKSVRDVVQTDNLGHSYGDINVFSGLNFILHRGDKVAFVGVNGSGKSTLSRLLSLNEKPTTGHIIYGDNVKMAFFSQESSDNLNYKNTIWDEVNTIYTKANDQDKRNLLGAFLFSGDDIFKSISILSGGEKSRLALLKIMLMDTNFLILDEPTNHLDLKTKDIFQEALIKYHGTVAIVSHDRYFLDCLVNKIFELKDKTITEYIGNYSYFIEKRALNNISSEINYDDSSSRKQSSKNKESKRLEAEERNRISRIKGSYKKELAEIENDIKLLEIKKCELETALCNPLILKDAKKIKEAQISLKDTDIKLELLYDKWSILEAKLDNIITPG